MNPKDLMYTQRKFSFLNLLSFLVFFVVLFYAVYAFVHAGALEAQVADADSQITTLQTQVDELEDQSLTEVTVAQQVIAAVTADEIIWSDVILDLIEVTPLSVYYSSYAGSESGKVTVSGLADDYYAVADLIDVLVDENVFKDVFAPSVATVTSGSEEMTSFSLNFTYDDSKTAR